MLSNPCHYRYAGRSLASSLPLPELGPASTAAAELRIDLVPMPRCTERQDIEWRHDFVDPGYGTTLTCARTASGHLLEFPDVATIGVSAGGDVHVSAWPGASIESVRHVLLDQALPRILAQRGDFLLHGAAIRANNGRTLLILGESGRGKSTLASAFTCAGAEVLTDDCLRIEPSADAVDILPTYPGLRLWPDSLARLFPDAASRSTPMAHYSDKRRLSLGDASASSAPISLDAIFVLAPPEGSDTISLAPLSMQQACLALVSNTFQLDLKDAANVERLLAQAAQVAARVPVRALTYPRDYARLPEVVAQLSDAA